VTVWEGLTVLYKQNSPYVVYIFVKITVNKLNICLLGTHKLVSRRFGLDRSHCSLLLLNKYTKLLSKILGTTRLNV